MVFTTFDASQINQSFQGPVNIVDNGGFEIWQRGTSFTNPVTQTYTADRWQVNGTVPSAYTITQESSIVDSGLYSLKMNITNAGSAAGFAIVQPMETAVPFRNKTVTLSMRVWSNIAGAAIYIHTNDTGNTFSTTHTGNSTYQTLTVTMTFSGVVTNCFFGFAVNTGLTASVGTFYIDSAILIIGSEPVAFVPMHPQVDLARCQRYYEAGHIQNTVPILRPGAGGGDSVWMITPFLVQKRAVPTMTATKVSMIISAQGGQSGGDSDDTASWTISVADIFTTGSSVEYSRATDCGFPAALAEYTWTASADL